MTIHIYICGDSPIDLWGLSGKQRLLRQIERISAATTVDDLSSLAGQQTVLLLRGDYLYDSRLLAAMVTAPEPFMLTGSVLGYPLAIKIEENAVEIAEAFAKAQTDKLPGLKIKSLADFGNAHDLQLRKYDSLTLLPIREQNRTLLEKELFSGSYKGVTDFVTKWCWPLPARWATHWCVKKGLQPNHVTILSVILAVLAGVAFYFGFFGIGLLMGWVMTFLDTVDGKLARVTVTSSKFGDILDHGLDLIHPPFWYLAWAIGLSTMELLPASVSMFTWLIFLGYIGGRLCEGVFELWLTRFPVFLWQEMDSFNRLITARRNPNMVFLTLSFFAGRPDIGLSLVVIWHLVSTLFLAWRVFLAWRTKQEQGELRSWLEDIDPERDKDRIAVRVFTRVPLKQEDIVHH